MTWTEDAETELRRVLREREAELAQWRAWAARVSPYLPPGYEPPAGDA